MRRRTREAIDGMAMVIGSALMPVGVWAQAGAATDTPSVVGVSVAVAVAGFAAIRLWLARDPRAVSPLPIPDPNKEPRQ